ncbi:hypothetical protein TrispH2_006220 [Trichoplax sp. H2]|nr:hypothetical protein TrispH2_006220 [Trichoplax sp. H2]|eukprot:RDD41645.1 hypothetical protein TrispH2_006220 [Trichoplax sp. H2]
MMNSRVILNYVLQCTVTAPIVMNRHGAVYGWKFAIWLGEGFASNPVAYQGKPCNDVTLTKTNMAGENVGIYIGV